MIKFALFLLSLPLAAQSSLVMDASAPKVSNCSAWIMGFPYKGPPCKIFFTTYLVNPRNVAKVQYAISVPPFVILGLPPTSGTELGAGNTVTISGIGGGGTIAILELEALDPFVPGILKLKLGECKAWDKRGRAITLGCAKAALTLTVTP